MLCLEETSLDIGQKLRDRLVSNQLAKREEYFLQDLQIARERLLADKRQFQEIISNTKTSAKAKLDAINADIQLNIHLLKMEYEGSQFIENYRQKQERLLTYRGN
jgi:tRNA A22 N-methylase